MVFSSDRLFTLRPQPGTEVTVDLAGTSLQLPVVGGRLALGICPNPDQRATVVVGNEDSQVPNRALAGTCTISDHLLDEEVWPNRSTFVAHLTKLADELLAAGVVNAAERAALISAGARSSVGGDEEQAPVGATVPATLSLALGAPASFGAFTPGVAREYTASTTANVISTAGDATLTASDPSSNAPGRLVNGAFSLPQPLQVAGSSLPATVKTYAAPVSNDVVAVDFSQSIAANDALRTGTYAKTLTFTLSTTNP